MAYKIQHLGLGGILDQSIAIVRDHFGLLFKIMACLLIPFTLLQNFLVLAMSPQLPAAPTAEDYRVMMEQQGTFMPLVIGLGILSGLFVIPLTNAAVIHAVARLYLGEAVSAGGALRHALSRFAPLVGTTILMWLAIWGGLILCIVPGILFALWFGLSQHVVIIEEISGQKALGRSKQLVRPNMGTLMVLGLVMGAITLGVAFSANFIPQVHVRAIAQTLLNAVTTMLWTASGVVFYFSCRCGVENFDLEYLAHSIGRDDEEGEAALEPAM